jgi:ABC-2 type transport system ATP-binding protein
MEPVLKINEISRSFDDNLAVNRISLTVDKGEMFGIVGPDGAGKTTAIRMLCGLLTPDGGTAEIFGFDLGKQKKEIQNITGYLSQKFSLYGDLTIDENIEFFASIHDVKNYEGRRNELLEFTRLTPFRDRLADKLSGGMKQKLALACSLIHTPKILFLDEPTTGVDPVSRRDFWKILSGLLKEGITIIMSTPYLDEAERCNRIALMHKGEIISLDTPAAIKKKINMMVIELVCSPSREAFRVIRQNTDYEVHLFGDRINIITSGAEEKIASIKTLLDANSITVSDTRIIPPSLENVFIHLVGKTY